MSTIYYMLYPDEMNAFGLAAPSLRERMLEQAELRCIDTLKRKVIPAHDEATPDLWIANFRAQLARQPNALLRYGFALSVLLGAPEPPVSEDDTAQGTPIIESAGIPKEQ